MVNSKITLKKFLKLYLQYKFYYILFYFVFVITGYTEFSTKGLLLTVFSTFYEVGRSYSGTYIVFFLFIPFLNVIARNISKKNYQRLLGLSLLMFSILPTLFDWYFGFNTFSFIGWMIITYFVGGYIALYPPKWSHSLRVALIGMVGSILINSLFILYVDFYLSKKDFVNWMYLVSYSNKILSIILAIFVFLTFKNLPIKNHKWINTVAASTFGILLIHTNSDVMRKFLWGTLCKCTEHYTSIVSGWAFIVYSLIVIIGTYVICFLLDFIRIKIVEKPVLEFVCSRIK